MLDEPIDYWREDDHHDEVAHIPEGQECRAVVLHRIAEPCGAFSPYAAVVEHAETAVLDEVVADARPRFAVEKDAAHLERQCPEDDEHVPHEIRPCEAKPSLAQLADIGLSVVLLHSLEEEVAREDEEQWHCATGYHHGDEEPDIVVYCHACQSPGMELRHVYLRTEGVDEHYEYGEGKPQHCDTL